MHLKQFIGAATFFVWAFGVTALFGRFIWSGLQVATTFARLSDSVRKVSPDSWNYLRPKGFSRSGYQCWSRWQDLVKRGFLEEHPELRPVATEFEYWLNSWGRGFLNLCKFVCFFVMFVVILIIIFLNFGR